MGVSDQAPCKFWDLTAKGQDLRAVLGPCIGPWNQSKGAIAGGFKHGGSHLCRHHYTFQKELGGSVERATKVAEYANKEGLLPPLVRLRVEHSASQILLKRVGKWVESGFEAGVSNSHTITKLKNDRWSIQSWVRLREKDGSTATLRHFSMELELDASRGKDLMESFSWTASE